MSSTHGFKDTTGERFGEEVSLDCAQAFDDIKSPFSNLTYLLAVVRVRPLRAAACVVRVMKL